MIPSSFVSTKRKKKRLLGEQGDTSKSSPLVEKGCTRKSRWIAKKVKVAFVQEKTWEIPFLSSQCPFDKLENKQEKMASKYTRKEKLKYVT